VMRAADPRRSSPTLTILVLPRELSLDPHGCGRRGAGLAGDLPGSGAVRCSPTSGHCKGCLPLPRVVDAQLLFCTSCSISARSEPPGWIDVIITVIVSGRVAQSASVPGHHPPRPRKPYSPWQNVERCSIMNPSPSTGQERHLCGPYFREQSEPAVPGGEGSGDGHGLLSLAAVMKVSAKDNDIGSDILQTFQALHMVMQIGKAQDSQRPCPLLVHHKSPCII